MNKFVLKFFSIFTIFAIASCAKEQPNIVVVEAINNDYENPLGQHVGGEKKIPYIADPYVIRDNDGYFYLYSTQTNVYTPNLTFKRGPVLKSIDLQTWEYVSDVFQSFVPSRGTSGAGVWAPTVLKVKDKWNFYYSLSTGGDENPGIGVATSDTPYGPWTHYGKLFNSKEIGVTNSIDPHVFYDNNQLYMVFGSFGGLITLIELTDDGLGLKNGLDYQKENKVALGGYEVFDTNNYEASFIKKHKDEYYLFLSTGTCCSGAKSTYQVVVGKSKSLKGPYLDAKGRDLFGPNRGEKVVVPSMSGAMGTGHCCLVEDDIGDTWLVYHGYDTDSCESNNRVLYMDKLIWDEETGYPHVQDNKATNHQINHGPYINILEKTNE